jgi:streptogramin lyase
MCSCLRLCSQVVHAIGGGLLSLPHMITLDTAGRVWVVDVGAHVVYALHPESGEVLLTLGNHHKPGKGPNQFCKPTHVS